LDGLRRIRLIVEQAQLEGDLLPKLAHVDAAIPVDRVNGELVAVLDLLTK
jgi:hypothetical protein